MQTQYIIYNGELKKKNDFCVRPYKFFFYDYLLVYNSEPIYFDFYFTRLTANFKQLSIQNTIVKEKDELLNLIVYLARKNKLYKYYRVKISFFVYSTSVHFAIETTPFNNVLINKVKLLNSDLVVPSRIYNSNFIIPYKITPSSDVEYIVKNNNNKIVGTDKSNLFLIKDKKIVTSPLSVGCYNGLYRKLLLDYADELGLLPEETEITDKDLSEADEVLLLSDYQSFRCVVEYRQYRYFKQNYFKILEHFKKMHLL